MSKDKGHHRCIGRTISSAERLHSGVWRGEKKEEIREEGIFFTSRLKNLF
jgi:hypothetical protein